MRSFRTDGFDCFVFDCDGVLLDSNRVKSQAFFETARPYGEAAATALVDYHRARGGETRQAKFAHFVGSILGRSLEREQALVDELVDRFAAICREELGRCAEIAGVVAFLESLPRSSSRYVVTGGAQDEVRQLLAERKLDRHFDLVLGNPASKLENMQHLEREGRLRGRGVYFGDAELDRELANRFGLEFVYVSGASEWDGGAAVGAGSTIVDFTELAPSTPAAVESAR